VRHALLLAVAPRRRLAVAPPSPASLCVQRNLLRLDANLAQPDLG